jgi:hypothetical protein
MTYPRMVAVAWVVACLALGSVAGMGAVNALDRITERISVIIRLGK